MTHLRTILLCAGLVLISFAARAAADEVLPAPAAALALPPPSANAFSVTVAFGPSDGLMYVWDGAQVLKQDDPDSVSYTSLGSVGSGSADAGPLTFSRDGGSLLIGNGGGGALGGVHAGQIFTIPAAGGSSNAPAGTVPYHDRFLAAPLGAANDLYFIDQGNASFTGSSVSVFSSTSGANVPVIENIPGASSAMALDNLGRLYVGVGFGPNRGHLRRFAITDLQTALDTSTPLDWTTGELFNSLDNNSGAGLHFDALGYLYAGGPNGVTVFDPEGNATVYDNGGFTYVTYDPFGDQLLVTGFGQYQGLYPTTLFRVPEPTTWALMLTGLAVLIAARRRRGCAN